MLKKKEWKIHIQKVKTLVHRRWKNKSCVLYSQSVIYIWLRSWGERWGRGGGERVGLSGEEEIVVIVKLCTPHNEGDLVRHLPPFFSQLYLCLCSPQRSDKGN